MAGANATDAAAAASDAARAAFFADIGRFYESFAYGMLVLTLPVLVWTLVFAVLLLLVGEAMKIRLAKGLGFLFILAFALIGCVSGTIAGVTLEAIVGAVLAALLGVVSSLLTYLFSRDSLRQWRPVIPLALIAMLVSTLVGLVIGGSRKTQSLAERDAAAIALFEAENADTPVKRELAIELAKKCVAERSYLEALETCH